MPPWSLLCRGRRLHGRKRPQLSDNRHTVRHELADSRHQHASELDRRSASTRLGLMHFRHFLCRSWVLRRRARNLQHAHLHAVGEQLDTDLRDCACELRLTDDFVQHARLGVVHVQHIVRRGGQLSGQPARWPSCRPNRDGLRRHVDGCACSCPVQRDDWWRRIVGSQLGVVHRR